MPAARGRSASPAAARARTVRKSPAPAAKKAARAVVEPAATPAKPTPSPATPATPASVVTPTPKKAAPVVAPPAAAPAASPSATAGRSNELFATLAAVSALAYCVYSTVFPGVLAGTTLQVLGVLPIVFAAVVLFDASNKAGKLAAGSMSQQIGLYIAFLALGELVEAVGGSSYSKLLRLIAFTQPVLLTSGLFKKAAKLPAVPIAAITAIVLGLEVYLHSTGSKNGMDYLSATYLPSDWSDLLGASGVVAKATTFFTTVNLVVAVTQAMDARRDDREDAPAAAAVAIAAILLSSFSGTIIQPFINRYTTKEAAAILPRVVDWVVVHFLGKAMV